MFDQLKTIHRHRNRKHWAPFVCAPTNTQHMGRHRIQKYRKQKKNISIPKDQIPKTQHSEEKGYS